MRILALDVGSTKTGWALRDHQEGLIASGKDPNFELLAMMRGKVLGSALITLIEEPTMIGQKAWKQVIFMALWAGKFEHAASATGNEVFLISRRAVKTCLLGASNIPGSDSHIIQLLKEAYSPDHHITNKESPLYGLKADAWQALALIEAFDQGCERRKIGEYQEPKKAKAKTGEKKRGRKAPFSLFNEDEIEHV